MLKKGLTEYTLCSIICIAGKVSQIAAFLFFQGSRGGMEVKILVIFIILTFLVSVGSVLAFDDPDLIFYFPFEEFDGNTALDRSGNGHNGTINGDINIVDDGKLGKAAKFARTSFIDMDGPNIPPEHIPTDEITLCAWVKCESTGDHHAIFNARAGDATWLIHPELRSDGNNFRWLLRGDGEVTIFDIRAGSVTWNEWIHFAGVYDGKKGTLYINGERVAEAPGGAKIAKDWGQGARIGYNIDAARPFTGLMDELSLWKRALTQDEIKILMEEGMKAFMAVSPAGSLTTTWGGLKAFYGRENRI